MQNLSNKVKSFHLVCWLLMYRIVSRGYVLFSEQVAKQE